MQAFLLPIYSGYEIYLCLIPLEGTKLSQFPFFLTVSTGIAGFALIAPEHAPYYLDIIKSWGIPTPITFTLKGLLVWPFMYHTCNGVRHLVSASFAIASQHSPRYRKNCNSDNNNNNNNNNISFLLSLSVRHSINSDNYEYAISLVLPYRILYIQSWVFTLGGRLFNPPKQSTC